MNRPNPPPGSWRLTADVLMETRRGRPIPNGQVFDIAAQERNYDAVLRKDYPAPCVYRTEMNPIYNCHGMTFASRRTWIDRPDVVRQIIQDDCYERVEERMALPGDIVLYVSTDDGDVSHSGTVVEKADGLLMVPMICSKWGKGSEVIHAATRCPYFRDLREYYRVTR